VQCELCVPAEVVAENAAAYARYESNSLAPGEQTAVLQKHSPDGYNVGVNIGKAAGQSRMHVHVHLIPRYKGDVPDPRGGVRRVLKS
jgi:hypothetical protein